MKMPIVDQMTLAPTRKVMAITVAGSLLTVAVWISNQFFGLEIPGEVQGAAHTAMAALVGYFVRDRMNS